MTHLEFQVGNRVQLNLKYLNRARSLEMADIEDQNMQGTVVQTKWCPTYIDVHYLYIAVLWDGEANPLDYRPQDLELIDDAQAKTGDRA